MTTAIVVKGYPRLSETFIAQEILALEKAGLPILIVSLRHPTDKARHPIHDEISAPVLYLPEYLWREPLRVIRGWWRARKLSGYRLASAVWQKDLVRDFNPNRIRRWGQALVLAAEMPEDLDHLYAHFLHTPSSVTRYAAAMRKLPWSASAHAVDIWTTPDWEKTEKLGDAEWVVTCTAANHAHLSERAPNPDRVSLVYHGLDLQKFVPPAKVKSTINKSNTNSPVVILSVGRLVKKKGYDDLIRALATIPPEFPWRLEHIGGGPEKGALEKLAGELGVAEHINWRGALAQEQVLEAYRSADIFALTSVIAPNGDRDGLPNVLMEAQSQYLPVIATGTSAIPEFIIHGETGLLADAGDIEGIAAHFRTLISDPDVRAAMGAAGRKRVADDFSFHECVSAILKKFGLSNTSKMPRVA